jgi:hypothetical protein
MNSLLFNLIRDLHLTRKPFHLHIIQCLSIVIGIGSSSVHLNREYLVNYIERYFCFFNLLRR